MSDEEGWGDDGWGEEGGGDDAGWGDDGEKEEAGWGDEGGQEAAGEGGWDGGDGQWQDGGDFGGGDTAQDGELPLETRITNALVGAEDAFSTEEKFTELKSLLAFSEEVAALEDSPAKKENYSTINKGLAMLIELELAEGDQAAALKYLQQMLADFVPNISANDAEVALLKILNKVHQSDLKVVQQVHSLLREGLDNVAMRFKFDLRECQLLYKLKEYKELSRRLDDVHESLKGPDGRDDTSRGSELLGVYAMKVRLAHATDSPTQMKRLFDATIHLRASVPDPRHESVIKEGWGMKYGDENNWDEAYKAFEKSFTQFVSARDNEGAKQCLKYTIVANLMCGSEYNPFITPEAKNYKNDLDVKLFVGLQQAYEKNNTSKFTEAVNAITAQKNPFINRHLEKMVLDFQGKSIVTLAQSYRRLKISFLAESLNITSDLVERILVQLILKGAITGKIDQMKGLLDMRASADGAGSRFQAIDEWVSYMESGRRRVPPINNSIPSHLGWR